MKRPILSANLSETEFSSWYWLRSELQTFCRELGLSPSGSKVELELRIRAALAGRDLTPSVTGQKFVQPMPTTFTPETVIGQGWKCSQALRSYFISIHGSGFSFNAALREFVTTAHGKTLAEASALYESTRNKPAANISGQFEYNRHMREFHAQNPGSTHQQAVEAWWAKRSKPDD